MIKNKHNTYKRKILDNKSEFLYGKMPTWKSIIRIGSTGLVIAFFMGLFTFIDQIMLVNFMPTTERFCFNNLFFNDDHDTFKGIVSNLSNYGNNQEVKNLYYAIINAKGTKNSTLETLVNAIANANGLGFYDSDSIVRSAVSLTVSLSDIVYVLPSLYSIGVSIKYSQALGMRNYKRAVHIWQNGFYGTIFVTFIGMLITFMLIPTIIPIQASIDNVSISDLQSIQKQLQLNLLPNNLNTNNFLRNGIETIHFANMNDTFQYYIYLGNNDYLNILNNNILNLNKDTISQLITKNLNPNDLSSFTISLYDNSNSSNTIMNIWNSYFNVVRNYSIRWAENFMFIINASLLSAALANLLIIILRSDGIILVVTFITIIPVFIQILLDYVLIVYAQIGMDGAAVATFIGWSLQLLWAIIYISFSTKLETCISWKALQKKYLNLNIKMLWQLCMYGGTTFVGYFGWMITDILLTNQVTYVSDNVLKNIGSEYYLSIMGAVLPIVNLFAVTIMGLMQYVSPFYSFNYAQNKIKRYKEAFWYTTLFTGVCSIFAYIIICFVNPISDEILYWFRITENNDYELLSSIKLLRIWFIQVVSYTLTITSMVCFLAANRPGLSTLFGLVRSCIFFIPFLYIFSSIAINYEGLLNSNLTIDEINNPLKNNAMWFFMWNIGFSYIVGAIVIFLFTLYFVYYYVQKPKRALIDCFPYSFFKNILINKLLNEYKKVNIKKNS